VPRQIQDPPGQKPQAQGHAPAQGQGAQARPGAAEEKKVFGVEIEPGSIEKPWPACARS